MGSVSYGAPGDAYALRVAPWSAIALSFVVPNGYSGPGLMPGTAATLQIVVGSGVLSRLYTEGVTASPVLPLPASSRTRCSRAGGDAHRRRLRQCAGWW